MRANIIMVFRERHDLPFPCTKHVITIKADEFISDQSLIDHFKDKHPKAYSIEIERF